MFLDQPLAWTVGHWPVVAAAGVLFLVLTGLAAYIAHRTSGPVLAAGIGALVCTGFSADTSWRFADHELHMDRTERLWLFAAGEIVLIVCAIMARSNKRATATKTEAGTPGVPGVMVWCIAAVQLVPAFAESGLVGGLVRSTFGPIMAALLWHLAMGLEIRVAKPEALSTGLPAQIGHELRERLLSYLGLATRKRSAEEITRDRAHARAVRLGARRYLSPWGKARLAAAVTRSRATVDGARRHQLLQDLAGRRTAEELRTMHVDSPWAADTATLPHSATPLGVAGAALRRMHPIDAIQAVRDAQPDATAPELASLCTEYGVTVTEGMVRIALHPKAAQPDAQPDRQPHTAILQPSSPPALGPAPQPEPGDFDSAAASAIALAQPSTAFVGEGSPNAAAHVGHDDALVLDLAPMLPVQPHLCAPAPEPVAQPAAPQATPQARKPRRAQAARPTVQELRPADADAQLLNRARELNTQSLSESGTKASLRLLQNKLRIGQRRAQRIQAQLPDTLPTASPDAQPPAKEA
ncbi:hypothetical protein [Streptomyces coerulescens]|uniref:Uncharacterized protein n=1 Tax=Streptomyces coerulescens TaxID=29304 RepID=A0ABW0CPV6_STRCD